MSPLPDVQSGNDKPLYNIGVVARMTGVSMATLRAWERRYEFPEADRTAGGHRLFSEKDVLRLRWVKARIDEGMQTAQAIHALRHQEQSGQVIFAAMPVTIEAVEDRKSISHLDVYRGRLAAALSDSDIHHADVILGEALAICSPEDLILDVISQTMAQIGEAWENNQINVATEHLATNYLRQRLLMWMVSGPPPKAINPILLACAPNEWHEGSLLILGALLRRRHWPIAYLGQAVPLPDLAGMVQDLKPSAVVLVAMTENSAAELAPWPNYLPEAASTGWPVIGYGGRIFARNPGWRLRVPGVYLGDNFRDGIQQIEKLIQYGQV